MQTITDRQWHSFFLNTMSRRDKLCLSSAPIAAFVALWPDGMGLRIFPLIPIAQFPNGSSTLVPHSTLVVLRESRPSHGQVRHARMLVDSDLGSPQTGADAWGVIGLLALLVFEARLGSHAPHDRGATTSPPMLHPRAGPKTDRECRLGPAS